MRIAIPKEIYPGENRVPITPDAAKKLCRMGAELVVEAGLGAGSGGGGFHGQGHPGNSGSYNQQPDQGNQ